MGRTVMILTKSGRCTYFIVPSVEVAHRSLPIFFLAFMARDGGETVECAWGQGSAWLASEGYQNDQRDRRRKGKSVCLCRKRRDLRRWRCLVGREVCL